MLLKVGPEIRGHVWELSIEEPRIVVIHVSLFNFKQRFSMTLSSTTPVPALLHVNEESRQIGLRFYTLHFGSETDLIYQGLATVYFEVKNDVVLFKHSDRPSYCGLKALEMLLRDSKYEIEEALSDEKYGKPPSPLKYQTPKLLEKVAFAAHHLRWRSSCTSVAKTLYELPNLKEIIVIAEDETSYTSLPDDEIRFLERYEITPHFKDARAGGDPNWLADTQVLMELLQSRSEASGDVYCPNPTVSLKSCVEIRAEAVGADTGGTQISIIDLTSDDE